MWWRYSSIHKSSQNAQMFVGFQSEDVHVTHCLSVTAESQSNLFFLDHHYVAFVECIIHNDIT